MSRDLRTVLEYPDYTEVSIRFSDQDSMGHLNNVAYAAYLEAGRIDFLHRRVSEGGGAAGFILAHISIDYIREAHYPGVLRIGNAVERIGTASLATCHGMFKDGELIAAGRSVLVCLDPETRRSQPVPDKVREIMAPFGLPGEEEEK
ncbi:MAG: acyl-CoA thioesterase [Gammaproteobacteria bacterium AqS3]|nr:acyl-CoA thioesterase [Gammaproteobacteria bacterium AqS3]